MAEQVMEFDCGEITNDIGFHDIKIDFNYGARVKVPNKAHVRIMDKTTQMYIFDDVVENAIVNTEKKYFCDYKIEIWCDDDYMEYNLDLEGKNVLIKFATTVMGDVLSWFGCVEEFQRIHKCKTYTIVSDALKSILEPAYPNIVFGVPDECYATYYMGIFFPNSDRKHQPMDFRHIPLAYAGAYILGLEPKERKARVITNPTRKIKEPYVCISVQATTQCKCWNNLAGWLDVVKYLKELGYRVLCIDRENVYGTKRWINTIPWGCEDFTGNLPLQERIDLLAHADFFVGLPSGLSWLAWTVGKPVVMIGGFSLPFTEFYNPYRVINFNTCTGCWNEEEFPHDDYGWCPRHKGTDREFECSRLISSGQVMRTIDKLRKDLMVSNNA